MQSQTTMDKKTVYNFTKKNDNGICCCYSVIYEYDSTTQTLKYGAYLVRMHSDVCDTGKGAMKCLRAEQKARSRFAENPVVVNFTCDGDCDMSNPVFCEALSKQVSMRIQPQKSVVNRVCYFEEDNASKHRNITVNYEYDRVTKTLKYGASIYCTKLDGARHFSKQAHRETARGRLVKCPVVVTGFEDNGNLDDFNKNIRPLLYRHGVTSKRSGQTTSNASTMTTDSEEQTVSAC